MVKLEAECAVVSPKITDQSNALFVAFAKVVFASPLQSRMIGVATSQKFLLLLGQRAVSRRSTTAGTSASTLPLVFHKAVIAQ